ncbi:Pyridoxal phosphate-dependent transferase, major region, subdomain 2 [Penicillium expansum]|uniref:Pyridoxal phosphate-dependent transferase, major region, subdomain 2 n=1 Tax=Penicillium expansum TaxID=27334 RepID=A0A0A2JUY5_PENEN|nr:Pyridoxal phosphate-dependent transferase, major region, subdomain 2 [Penicillium expansum]KGO59252.1 Pyridoxal phosphate-dependent transferase, major region, subdomain 2 [Penicillium expansum]KGO59771.1 Pyridoxal phosphate-dependent transferase, major region, subdomain 2 [Penicillium expansum]
MGPSIETQAGLSLRGAENVVRNEYWRDIRKLLAVPYDKIDNPNGIINLGLAENYLMHTEISDRLKTGFNVDLSAHLTYGQGPVGSPRLLKALANFFNTNFDPIRPVSQNEILVTSGVAALIDTLTWCICDDNEGILIPQPLYVGFEIDIQMRSRGQMIPVSFLEPDREYSVDHTFEPEANRRAFERAYKEGTEKGIKVRAVILLNPHNPLGRCYSPETIKEVARFCDKYDLHLICDEIYANSVFVNPDELHAQQFTSALSMNLDGIISQSRIHIMYGMSKDFCANGLRLGVLQTRNKDLLEAVASINNAAFYLWIRLFPARIVEADALTPSPNVSNIKRLLVDTCKRNGLSIKDGAHYFAEEPENGWFRVTFTVSNAVLEVAMERLVKSLDDLEWLELF